MELLSAITLRPVACWKRVNATGSASAGMSKSNRASAWAVSVGNPPDQLSNAEARTARSSAEPSGIAARIATEIDAAKRA